MGNIFGTWKCIFFGPVLSIDEKARNYSSAIKQSRGRTLGSVLVSAADYNQYNPRFKT